MNPIGMHYGFWSHNWDEIAYIPLMEKLARLGFDICEVASAEWGYYDDARLRELKACADMVDMLDAKMFSLNQAIMEIGRTRREEAEKKLEEERLQEEARQQAQRAREIVEGQKAGQGTEPENGGKA